MNYQDRIIRDLRVCGGQPVVKGTRVTLSTVLSSLAEGASIAEILDRFSLAHRRRRSCSNRSCRRFCPRRPSPFPAFQIICEDYACSVRVQGSRITATTSNKTESLIRGIGMKKEERTGIDVGVRGSAENYADNVKFGGERGHGFAGERANHLKDSWAGKKAKLTGDDNAKNGADRLVDGVKIQTKYCKTGSKCISECFENNTFRYLNSDGTPMQIEVPSDKYDSARAGNGEQNQGRANTWCF